MRCKVDDMSPSKPLVPLSKRGLAKITRWFNERVTRKACPCCEASAVVVWPYLTCVPLISKSGSSGQRFAVVVECRSCGHLRSFSAEKIGLVTRTAPATHKVARHIH